MSATSIISLVGEEARYEDSIALSNINLSVKQGEKLALIGRSGSGKSTLLRLIYERYAVGTALVPQNEGLVETLSVFHNVYMGRLASRPAWYNLINLIRPFPNRVSEVQGILRQLSLAEKCFEPVASLSGGQRQRTAVARSLYQGGELLLADEPVSAVDEQQAEHILQLLSQHFSTVIVALHDTQLALSCCDRVIGLKAGEIVLDSPSNDLSASELTQLYLD